MTFVSGLVGQAGRNVTLEPWRGNTRATDKPTRAGEVITDSAFIFGGVNATAVGLRFLRGGSSPLARIGGAVAGATGLVAAATGVKNLLAKLPATHPDTPVPRPGPPQHDPAPEVPDTDPVVPDPAPKPTIHTVRPGETLSFIADCYLTDWRDLYAYNRDKIGPNPDTLAVGTRLAIPPKDYERPAFRYTPTAPPGQLPKELLCLPDSPKAKLENCD